MSRISINKNNQAIENINSAIRMYEDAISTISATNDNAKTKEIIALINGCIANLSSVKSKINDINSQISNEIRRVELLEKKKKTEGDASENR